MGLILILIGAAVLALPYLSGLNPNWQQPETTLSPGSDAVQAGRRVCVGGIAGAHEDLVPSPLDADEEILWCHAVVRKSPMPRLGKGPPATRTLRASTWFRLVDPNEPAHYLLVDGQRLSPALVSLDHDPEDDLLRARDRQPGAQDNPLIEALALLFEMARSMSSSNIKIIRPGDRLWISGRLRKGRQGLYLGRWARIDNVPPQIRRQHELANARLTAFIAGPALVLLGIWVRLG